MKPRVIQSPGPATHGRCEALVAPRNIHEDYRQCRGSALNVREGIWVCISHSNSQTLVVDDTGPLDPRAEGYCSCIYTPESHLAECPACDEEHPMCEQCLRMAEHEEETT